MCWQHSYSSKYRWCIYKVKTSSWYYKAMQYWSVYNRDISCQQMQVMQIQGEDVILILEGNAILICLQYRYLSKGRWWRYKVKTHSSWRRFKVRLICIQRVLYKIQVMKVQGEDALILIEIYIFAVTVLKRKEEQICHSIFHITPFCCEVFNSGVIYMWGARTRQEINRLNWWNK